MSDLYDKGFEDYPDWGYETDPYEIEELDDEDICSGDWKAILQEKLEGDK